MVTRYKRKENMDCKAFNRRYMSLSFYLIHVYKEKNISFLFFYCLHKWKKASAVCQKATVSHATQRMWPEGLPPHPHPLKTFPTLHRVNCTIWNPIIMECVSMWISLLCLVTSIIITEGKPLIWQHQWPHILTYISTIKHFISTPRWARTGTTTEREKTVKTGTDYSTVSTEKWHMMGFFRSILSKHYTNIQTIDSESMNHLLEMMVGNQISSFLSKNTKHWQIVASWLWRFAVFFISL